MEENQVYAAEAPQNETQAQAAAVPQSDPAVQNAPNDNTAQGAPETQPNPNQQTIDRAMGQRLYAARQKWEREHRPVQDFARRMRAFFPGMDEAQIYDRLVSEHAAALTREQGIPSEAALELVQARLARETGHAEAWWVSAAQAYPEADAPQDARAQLVRQAEEILDIYGVNMVDVLQGDPSLLARVAAGDLDMRQAHAVYLRGRAPRAYAPPLVRNGGRGAGTDVEKLSAQDMHGIRERLARGETVALD